MATPLRSTHRRLEELIGCVTLWLFIFFGVVSPVTIVTLTPQAERAAREGQVAEAHLLGVTIRAEFTRFEAEFRQHPAVARLLVKREN